MKLDEYAGYDGLGLAALVRSGQVSPSELADTAQSAIDAVNPTFDIADVRFEGREHP
jgi:amidase